MNELKSVFLLRIFLDQAANRDAALHWASFDAKGCLLHLGVNLLAELPVALRLECVLSAEQVLFLQQNMPTKRRVQIEKMLPFTLEDKLLSPADKTQFVLGEIYRSKTNSFMVQVAILDKAYLADWLFLLQAAGQRVTAVYSVLHCLPISQQAQVALWDGQAIWALSAQESAYLQAECLSEDATLFAPPIVWQEDLTIPYAVWVLQHPEVIRAWQAQYPQIEYCGDWHIGLAQPQAGALNLLPMQPVVGWVAWRAWRFSLILALCGVGIYLLLQSWQYWQDWQAVQTLQTQIQSQARLVLGATSQIPKYQEVAMLENKYKQLMPSLQDADAFLVLMQRIQPVMQAYLPMQRLVYQENRAKITLPLLHSSPATSALRAQLEAAGVQVESVMAVQNENMPSTAASGALATPVADKALTVFVLALPTLEQERGE